MSRKKIGIVDYGVGNHASVKNAFQSLGHQCWISRDPEVLADSDVIVLPGVGAYPAAMAALRSCGMDEFLREWARLDQPMIGLCLGMQLLADESLEHTPTAGLGLIPGKVVPLESARWHIGWNSIEVVNENKLMLPFHGESVYFNHSHVFVTSKEYQVCVSSLDQSFVAGVRCGNVVGFQFHPEKSQTAGRTLLRNVVEGLTHA